MKTILKIIVLTVILPIFSTNTYADWKAEKVNQNIINSQNEMYGTISHISDLNNWKYSDLIVKATHFETLYKRIEERKFLVKYFKIIKNNNYSDSASIFTNNKKIIQLVDSSNVKITMKQFYDLIGRKDVSFTVKALIATVYYKQASVNFN